jgi:signal transduction histidine kinase
MHAMNRMLHPTRDLRLLGYVFSGGLAGCAYVAFDLVSEARIGAGTLHGGMSNAHAIIDHTLPILVGLLLGVCGHYFRLRARLTVAEVAASRADALRLRLQKVERDQAIWVLAAAILHELNNPLHAIGLLLDELDDSAHDAVERDTLLSRLRGQSERALSALRRLRSLRGVIEPRVEPTELSQLLNTLVADASSIAAEDGVALTIESRGEVRASADPDFIRTIVENLVDNSLQSLRSGGGSRITITLEAAHHKAVVRVSDDGPALDPALVSGLFTPLVSSKQTGLGLGLPIARALARAMRGELLLEDAAGKGFALELPLLEAA